MVSRLNVARDTRLALSADANAAHGTAFDPAQGGRVTPIPLAFVVSTVGQALTCVAYILPLAVDLLSNVLAQCHNLFALPRFRFI